MKKRRLLFGIIVVIIAIAITLAALIHPRLYWLSNEKMIVKLTDLGCDFSDTEHDVDFYRKLRRALKHFEWNPDSPGIFEGYALSHKYQQMVKDAVRKYYNLDPDPIEY